MRSLRVLALTTIAGFMGFLVVAEPAGTQQPYSAPGKPVVGGLLSPDQTVRIVGDLPRSEKKANTGGRDGAGLCVFTSCEWAGRFQNELRLFRFQEQMRAELGGGWPEKLDQMIAKYAPGTRYVQHTTGDLEFLRLAVRTGRMPCVTYGGYDPHYGQRYVAHMVNLVALTDTWSAISDNNFPGDGQIVWMSPSEFSKRWKIGGGGWGVVLLSPPPPPRPKVGEVQ